MPEIAVETFKKMKRKWKEKMNEMAIWFFFKNKSCIVIRMKMSHKETLKISEIYIENRKFHLIKKAVEIDDIDIDCTLVKNNFLISCCPKC